MAAKWQQWMPLHIDKWRGSPAVRAMHPAARMGYLELLLSQWQSDDCSLPSDPMDLAELSGLGDELWAMYSARILRNFEATDNGRLRNPVCFEEWQEAKRVFEARRASAERTNTVRKPNGDRDGDRGEDGRSPSRRADTITGTVTLTEKQVSEAKASSPRRDADGAEKQDPLESIYSSYPRKEGKRAALKAMVNAVARLRKGEQPEPPMTVREAQVYLYRRVQTYARSPAGLQADKTRIPHPATWFNQSRYLDDESNWQLTGNSGAGHATLGNSNLEALRQSLAEDQDGTYASRHVSGGQVGCIDDFPLLISPRARAV